MDKYLKAIKQNVCSICVDSNERGGCTLNSSEICALELYLPQLVEIIKNNEKEDYSALHFLVHEKICGNCKSQENGYCKLREDANCSIDRYFNLVVDTIKNVK